MPDFQPPQWSEFKVPGGGADLSYVGPVANAYSAAAEMATKPLNRMLEQVLASRLSEKAMLQQQQYASQQQARAFQDQTMRDRLNDAAALDRINTEYDRRDAQERIKQEEQARQAQAMTSALYGGTAGLVSPAGGVAPGTGPLSFEGVYGAGPVQQDFAPPPPGLDPSQISTVYNAQAIRAERNQNNAEQAAKDARAQVTAQAQMQAVGTTIAQAPIPPEVKAALMARAQGGDPDGAAGQLADFLKPAPPRQKTASELKKDEGFIEHDFGGGKIDLPVSLAKDSDAYIKAGGAISKLPADGKAALTLQAQEIVNKTIRATDPVMAAVLDGTMSTKDDTLKAAIKTSYDNRVSEQIPLLAQSLGWKTDEQMLAEGMATSAPPAPAPAPVAATQQPAPPTVDGMQQFLGGVQSKYGIPPEEVKAFNDELRALIDAGKREEAAKLLKSKYDKRMSDSAKQGWTEQPKPMGFFEEIRNTERGMPPR